MPPPAAVPAPCSSRLFRLLRAFSAVNPPGVSPPGSRVFCFLGCGMEQRGCGGEDARSGAVAPPVLLNLPDPLPEGFLGRSVRGSSLCIPAAPSALSSGGNRGNAAKKRQEPRRVPSPTVPLFPQRDRSRAPGAPGRFGRRRMRHLGVSLCFGGKGG